MKIYCCNCEKDVNARLTDGEEIYPNRSDLYDLPFWKCDDCGEFVGCHHQTSDRTKPLGVIPTKEIKQKRQEIHRLMDPIWKNGKMRRNELYKKLSKTLGYNFHTAGIKTVKEADFIIQEIKKIRISLAMLTKEAWEI